MARDPLIDFVKTLTPTRVALPVGAGGLAMLGVAALAAREGRGWWTVAIAVACGTAWICLATAVFATEAARRRDHGARARMSMAALWTTFAFGPLGTVLYGHADGHLLSGLLATLANPLLLGSGVMLMGLLWRQEIEPGEDKP